MTLLDGKEALMLQLHHQPVIMSTQFGFSSSKKYQENWTGPCLHSGHVISVLNLSRLISGEIHEGLLQL